MKINTLVSNVISICFCILVFLIAFIWIAFHFNDSTTAFKDSLSIGASLFGGIATFSAAYIASKLVIDWKNQTKYNEQLKCLAEILSLIDALEKEFEKLNNNEPLFQYLCQFFKQKTTFQITYTMPDFTELNSIINSMRTNFFKIEMYYNYQDKFIFTATEEMNSFLDIQNTILMWKLNIESIDRLKHFTPLFISRAFDCNDKIYRQYSHIYPDIPNSERSSVLLRQLNLLKEDCKTNRIRLEKYYK